MEGKLERPAPAGEVLGELGAQARQEGVFTRGERAPEPAAEVRELGFEHPPIGEFQEAHATIVRTGEERAERALDPAQRHAVDALFLPRCRAERPHEGVAEAVVRKVAAVEDGVVHVSSF